MSRSPFINDPREELSKQIALAVASPIEDVRAIHLRAAEQAAELAKANGLTLKAGTAGKRPQAPRANRETSQEIPE